MRETAGAAASTAAEGMLREGDRVVARYRGSRKHYPGVVLRDNRDGTCGVAFDDGDRERAVPKEHIAAALTAAGCHGGDDGGGGGGAENNTGMLDRMEAEQRRLEARQSSGHMNDHSGNGGYYGEASAAAEEAWATAPEARVRGVVGRGRHFAGRAADRYGRWAEAHPRAGNVLGKGALVGAVAARVLLRLL